MIAILSAADPDFPLSAWDLLIDQAELTMNMMRGSNVNPLLSAYDQLHGAYDFNAHPLAPPGTKVLAFEDWAHGVQATTLGQPLNTTDVTESTSQRPSA